MADLSNVRALLSELERFEGRTGSFRIGTDDNEVVLFALRIAARVLDEGAVERAKDELSKHIRVDAAGLSPAVVQHFVLGLDEAAQAVIKHLTTEEE